MENPRQKGSRIIGAIIVFLIILFLTIEFFIREAQEFSPTSVTNVLLASLQIIVLLLFLILLFVLGRNLMRLYLERKRKVIGSHFKTKLVVFFTALSLVPTLLLFVFAGDLIRRNIEYWFKTPIDRILDDTKNLADGFYMDAKEDTFHYAQQLSKTIKSQKLINPENTTPLKIFIRDKLKEYHLDEIGIFLNNEELFSYLNPNLPFQDYRNLDSNLVMRAHLGEEFSQIDPMGNGEIIRRGISINIPDVGTVLVVTGKFLPQNYAQRINNITSYVQRYRQLKIHKNPMKTFYLLTLIFITLLIIFSATWIGFHLAKSITVPIEKLAQATKEVSRGNLNVKVEDPASDELGSLIESFNQMIHDLKNSQKNIAQKTSELEAGKNYTETVLNNISTGVMALDAKGYITTINPSARSMLELTDCEPLGKKFTECLHNGRYDIIVKNIRMGLDNKFKSSEKEITIDFGAHTRSLALTVSPLQDSADGDSGIIIVLDDLTQLIKAQKISAWKEVAQRVAHEIKNPLTPIQLSAERIIKNLKKASLDDKSIIEEGAQTIVEEARTIKSLVDEFSNFARMPKVSLQPADIHDIIRQTLSLFKGIFTDIEFEVQYSTDIPSPIKIDPDQMKRVFINIIDNAIDAMNKKGKITIRTELDKKQQYVRIEITDSGPGIPMKDKDKLFLPNYSTKKKGTGLGLSIVNQVVSEHNGSIEIENIRPQGAKFIISIPL
ncbi:MAG: HAMP domain-containing protein [Candidatus Aminicenantes bacterium]|nr:HAMP domain-containing protein [Candidatus Aminicenantes bacterium]